MACKKAAPVKITELRAGLRLRNLLAGSDVVLVAAEAHGEGIANVVYRSDDGAIADRLVTDSDLEAVVEVTGSRWTFDADGAAFRLASEARRIELAHVFDPFAAVEASTIRPLPHQIEAVYDRLLPQQPLHFLLADDPGAGKTVMSGLYIRELLLRGDLARCLIIAPGSLVEQWQEELYDKFDLRFDILSRDMVEGTRTGNPFLERNLLIARLDQLSRSEELKARLNVSDWDLIIVDEAHKMSAHLYGDEVKKTQRYVLGELVRDRTRNLLLLTATPHNGSNDDFLLFMSLLDPDQFAGKLRHSQQVPDCKDVMRRYAKENLLTFEGKRLFPERRATTVTYPLSDAEQELYDDVTTYVREGMGRAQAMEEHGDRRRGLAVGFALAALQRRLASSPEAILQSLRRRRERLAAQLETAERAMPTGPDLDRRLSDPDGFDADDFDDDEFEHLEDEAIEATMSASSIAELRAEIVDLQGLEASALKVRTSGEDRKWVELSSILQSDELSGGNPPRKLIVFTEHKDTLNYLVERIRTLLGRPEAVVAIHGGVHRDERRRIQAEFRHNPSVQILVATDAAGEGVNLQRANLMVNYDLPWNPNRIEQRFGRIHRIGQGEVCHLWNLIAEGTREGMVFQRLFEKIDQQRKVYGDQIYDVLGDAQINRSLQDLLIEAIRYGERPDVRARVDEVINADIGARLISVLEERALSTVGSELSNNEAIRRQMEIAQARKLQPGFVEAFFTAALTDLGGRITLRERGRFEITRVPAVIRSKEREATVGAPLQSAYERVTFDKDRITLDDREGGVRAELLAPGNPLVKAVIETVLERYGATLTSGSTLVDATDDSTIPRVLIYLEHSVSDGRMTGGKRHIVSTHFQFVEVDPDGTVSDPGAEPYLNYEPLTEDVAKRLVDIDVDWAGQGIDEIARDWATANLATPHYREIAGITAARVDKTRRAVEERLNSEIRYWDRRAAELKQQELQGKKPQLNSGRARQRADDLEARKTKRFRELDAEADLVNQAPRVVAAALILPQGFVNRLLNKTVADAVDPEVAKETDRRAVAAVMSAERSIGRVPVEQAHNNPGFDILSEDPITGMVYQVEVKGHRPGTKEVNVHARQVRQAQQNPERFRLAIVLVPNVAGEVPAVSYFVRPFDGYDLHFAQTYVPLSVAGLAPHALEPQ
jgi:SNF2 family DNA or RNA helicase